MAERKQVQKSHGVKRFFVMQILLDFVLERLDIGENISVREHDAAWFRRGTGGINNLEGVAAGKSRRRVRRSITAGEVFGRSVIDRYNNYAGEKTPEKRSDPFR